MDTVEARIVHLSSKQSSFALYSKSGEDSRYVASFGLSGQNTNGCPKVFLEETVIRSKVGGTWSKGSDLSEHDSRAVLGVPGTPEIPRIDAFNSINGRRNRR
jgi:hypothetical protein